MRSTVSANAGAHLEILLCVQQQVEENAGIKFGFDR